MMVKYSVYACLIVALLLPAGARADVLVLEGDERLSGRMIRVREGSLVFRTQLEGQMMVPMEHVTALATDENYVVTLQDATVRYGRFATDQGEAKLLPIDGSVAVPITLAEVREAALLPRSDAGAVPDASWNLRLETGVQARSGQGSAVEPVLSLGALRRTDETRLDAGITVERADPEDFPAWMRAHLEWQSLPDGWGPYAAAAVRRDTDNALSMRAEATIGAGRVLRSWGEGDEGLLEGLLGLNLAYSEWERAGRRTPWEDRDASQGADLNLHLGLRYARRILGSGEVRTHVALYPGLSDWGTVRANAETSVTVPLRQQLRLRLYLLLDYERDPGASDADPWSTAVGASVQVGF